MNERVMQFRVGVMVLATLLIAGILIMLFNEPRDLISAVIPSAIPGGKYTLMIRFDQAPNVNKHTPVHKSGVRIGRVSEIELLDDGGVLVTVKIDGNRRLRHNETFRARSSLLGDAVIEVIPGDPAAAPTVIQDGETLDGLAALAPEEALQNLEQNLAQVIASVTKASDALQTASVDLGTAARNITEILETNREGIDTAVDQANRTLTAVAKAAEDFDKLMGDEQIQKRLRTVMNDLPDTLAQMKRTMAQAETRLSEMENFTQILGSQELVDRIDRGTRHLDAVMQDLSVFSQKLSSPHGSLGLLLDDRRLYDHLNRAATNIDELTRQLKPIVRDVRVFTDKIARHPERLGVRGALERQVGIK